MVLFYHWLFMCLPCIHPSIRKRHWNQMAEGRSTDIDTCTLTINSHQFSYKSSMFITFIFKVQSSNIRNFAVLYNFKWLEYNHTFCEHIHFDKGTSVITFWDDCQRSWPSFEGKLSTFYCFCCIWLGCWNGVMSNVTMFFVELNIFAFLNQKINQYHSFLCLFCNCCEFIIFTCSSCG